MAGKPATISDLFAPMQSIEACISSQGGEINSNLVSINHAILNCATTLSDGSTLLKNITKDLKKTIDGSLKSLNDAAQKQATAGASASAGMAAAVSSSIGSGFAGTNEILIAVSQQLIEITKYVKDIEVRVRGKFNLSDKLRDKFKEKKTDKATEKAVKKIKAPDVSGGKGAGDLAKALAEAAKIIDGVGLIKSKLIKKKAENVLGGILDVFEKHKKELTPANMKKYELSVKGLENVAKEINAITKTMAKTTPIAPFAIIGSKLSKIVISSTLDAIHPLSKNKSLSKTVIAARNLKKISKSILEFSAAMALNTILAAPAMIGTALAGVIIREALFVMWPLGKIKTTKNTLTAAANLATIGVSILKFTAAMALTSILAIPAAIGVGMSFLLIKGSTLLFKNIGNQKNSLKIKNAAISIELMCMSMIGFTLTLLATTMITKYLLTGKGDDIDVTNVIALGGAVVTFGLMLGALAVYKRLGKAKNVKNVLLGGASVAMMSASFILFSLSLLVSYMVTKTIINDSIKDGKFDVNDIVAVAMITPMFALMLGSYAVFKKIGSPRNAKKVLTGGLAILMMSLGFVIFSSALYLTHNMISDMWKTSDGKMTWGDLFKTVAVFGLMYMSMLVFKAVGQNWKDVMKGSAGVALMGVAISVFGFGLPFFTDAIKGESAGHLMMIPVLLGALGFEFAVLGKLFKDVALGSATVLAMSVAVGAFGFGLHFFIDSLKGVDWGTVGKMAALIGIFGLEFALLGVPVVAGCVVLGSAAIITVSAALYVFGQSVKSFIDPIKSLEPEVTEKMAKLIGTFAREFAIIGTPLVAPFISIGAGAMIIAAGALHTLGKAMKVWSETDMDMDKLNLLCVSVDRIKLAFQGNPEGKKEEGGFFSKLGNAISGAINAPFDSAAISMTAVSLAIASGAITNLSVALKKWSEVNITDDSLALLCITVDRIKLAFQGYPDGEKPDKGFWGNLKASVSGALNGPFDIAKMRTTALGLMVAGNAIKILAKSLSTWEESNLKTDSIDSFITIMVKLKDAFGQIGADDREKSSSLLKSIIGVDFSNLSSTSVERGIKLTKKMGKAISELSKGLTEFQEGVGSKFKDNKFIEDFAITIGNVVTSLSTTFAQLVSEENIIKSVPEKKGLFGTVFSELFGDIRQPKSKIAEGIKTVKDLGSTIKDIADGMKEFADFIPKNNNSFVTDVAAGISALLQGIQEPLVAFGTTDESFSMAATKASAIASKYSAASASIHEISAETMNFQHHKVDVANAIAHVGEIGELVKGLAEGVKIMADPKLLKYVGNAGTMTEDFIVGNEATGAIGNIQKLVCSNLAIFLQLGKKIEEIGVYEAFHDEIVQDTRRGGKVVKNKTVRVSEGKKSYITMAVGAAVGIGQVITGLAEGYKNMNDIFPSDKEMTEGVARVGNAVISIMTAFSVIGSALVEGVPGQFYDAVPGNPELSKLFGPVPGQMIMLNTVGNKPFDKATQSIASITNGLASNLKTLVDEKGPITEFPTLAKSAFESLTSFVAMAAVLSDHTEGTKTAFWAEGKGYAYSLHVTNEDMMKSAATNMGSVEKVMNIILKIFTNLNNLPKDSAMIKGDLVESALNLSYIAKAVGDHTDGETVVGYTGGKGILYKMRIFDNSIANSATNNSKLIYDTILNLSNSMEPLSKLKVGYGDTFVNFAAQMTKGMNTLSGTRTNIVHATNFVEKLRIAVKEDVFGNISSNTQKIASAINSIDNEIFEPYAKMIGALGTMTENHSEFVKMQKELYELLEKIIDKINEVNSSAPQATGGETTSTGSTNSQNTQKSQQSQQHKQQNLTARLTPTKVALDTGTFISDFENMLKRVRSNNYL